MEKNLIPHIAETIFSEVEKSFSKHEISMCIMICEYFANIVNEMLKISSSNLNFLLP